MKYVYGHCGWDWCILVRGEPCLDTGRRILEAHPNVMECAFVNNADFLVEDDCPSVEVSVMDRTTDDWIPACGGVTQLLGVSSYATNFLADCVDVANDTRICLFTDVGRVWVNIDYPAVVTDMSAYARFLTNWGIQEALIDFDLNAVDAGEFLVVNQQELSDKFGVSCSHRTDAARKLCSSILEDYGRSKSEDGPFYLMLWDGATYSGGSGGSGDQYTFRLYPRFQWDNHREFQCGSGAVAVTAGLLHTGYIGSQGFITYFWGTSDKPISTVRYQSDGKEFLTFSYCHSHNEIVSYGNLLSVV